ncbi:MAG: GNAT family N-acetyltransferase [Chloroflexota bacterium]
MFIREMTIDDHEALIQILNETPGVTVRETDSQEAIQRYLDHNPGMSFVAVSDGEVVGCVLSGHDGRRGYLHHMAVKPAFRRQGIGQQLSQACIRALQQAGIMKTHLFVFTDNDLGNRFWQDTGWQYREDINMYSFNNSTNNNV